MSATRADPEAAAPASAMAARSEPQGALIERIRLVLRALCFYYLTTLLVWLGILFSGEFIARRPHPQQNEPGFLNAHCNWDGVWYSRIVEHGYSYDPRHQSTVAFFPAYPAIAALVKKCTGVSTEWALLIVSHCCLAGAFALMAIYAQNRFGDGSSNAVEYTLLALGLLPTTCFFRMAYTESLFLIVMLGAMICMQRSRGALGIAILVGLATACRPVGVALLPPFIYWIWRNSRDRFHFLGRCAGLLPVAVWGIAGYLLFQYATFGDPFAFLKTQEHWAMRPPLPTWSRITGLLTLEPLWSVYVPSSEAYWRTHDRGADPLFSLQFANPVYFVATVGLVIVGARRRWLTVEEVLLAAFLLLIPYVTHSQRAVMMAQGRYAAAVFPIYLVLGRLAVHAPPALTAGLFTLSGGFLLIYSALFAGWYRFI